MNGRQVLTSNASIVRYSDTAKVIKCNGSHLTGTPSSVLIVTVILRHWIGIIAIDVVRCGRILQKEEKKHAYSFSKH